MKISFCSILCALALTLFMQCQPETAELTDYQLGYHYYPIHVGLQWKYQCDSILYQRSNGVKGDTVHCEIMEVITDSTRDPEGNPFYNLEIFYRKDETRPWALIDNAFLTVTPSSIIRQDGGLDFVKMIFPVIKNKSWNGNIRISQENEIKLNGEFFKPFAYWSGKSYYYTDILDEIRINDIFYKKVLDVEEVNYTDDINRIYSTARYAEDVGPIYREFWLLSSDNPDPSIPWTQKADFGAIIKMSRIK